MIVSTTELRKNLFAIFDTVAHGETVTVTRGGRPVARVCPIGPAGPADWRTSLTRQPRLLAAPDEAFAPLDELWQDRV